MYFQAILADG